MKQGFQEYGNVSQESNTSQREPIFQRRFLIKAVSSPSSTYFEYAVSSGADFQSRMNLITKLPKTDHQRSSEYFFRFQYVANTKW